MQFSHHPELWSRFPELVAGVVHAEGLHADADVASLVSRFEATARERLQAAGSEAELPEVQAWRRAFSRMGLKPTQYRCASESLLRRLRKEGDLPRIHPLIDLCNAVSVAFAIPVAALDVSRIDWPLQVRPAAGTEHYLAFSGETEHPEPGEVSFVDANGQAHARRWTHRQSGHSAVRSETREVLIVAEALHPQAAADVPRLVAALSAALAEAWGAKPTAGVLGAARPVFDFGHV
ncbi:MAG TPA: phenylalanine--tRNA ligase beta subunit-related protein [Ramlibacter sp.]|nr:phenylalanine--tRNA ligase beta subunit-related protein [Ramlibacter sp.]